MFFLGPKVEKNLRLIWSKDKTSLVRFSQEVRRERDARERERERGKREREREERVRERREERGEKL